MSEGSNTVILLADREHIDGINELRKAVSRLHSDSRPDIFRSDFCAEFLGTAADKIDSATADVVCAVTDGEVSGYAIIDYISVRESAYTTSFRFCHISEFGVGEDFRRQGIATKMVEYIRRLCAKRGISRIDLDVWSFNEAAIRLYRKLGFSSYRIMMESIEAKDNASEGETVK